MAVFFIDNTFQGNPVDMARFCHFDQGSYDPLTAYLFERLPYLPMKGAVNISAKWQHRSDLVSWHVYGMTQWWWILLMYNGLTSNEEVVSGLLMAYPDSNSINEFVQSANERRAFTRCKNLRVDSMAG